jgi:hypothetical protein
MMCDVACSVADGLIRCPPVGTNQAGDFVTLQYEGSINATIWGHCPTTPIFDYTSVAIGGMWMMLWFVCCLLIMTGWYYFLKEILRIWNKFKKGGN